MSDCRELKRSVAVIWVDRESSLWKEPRTYIHADQ